MTDATRNLLSPDGPSGGAARPADEGTMLDPANQSLADALKLIFVLIQIGVIVIVVLYAFSGFQSIREGQSGVRLLFGKVEQANLDPGFRFSFPYPVGELLKIETGVKQFQLDREFFQEISPGDEGRPLEQLGGRPQLNPERDGVLLTADNSLVHTRWHVEYSPRDAKNYAETILPQLEEAIVRSAVAQGVVQAVAEVRLDDFLRQSDSDPGSVASRAREIAQASLDRSGVGIAINQLNLKQKVPPLFTYPRFAAVQNAEQNAAKKREEAEQHRRSVLNATAGAAVPYLRAEIDRFELAVEQGDAAQSALILARINDLLESKPVEIEGVGVIEGITSGAVSKALAEAEQYRTGVVNRRRAELTRFLAKLEQYRTNPLVTIHREWADAHAVFSSREFVQKLYLPPGTSTLQLSINADPEFQRRLQQERARIESERAAEERMRQLREGQLRTPTGLQKPPES